MREFAGKMPLPKTATTVLCELAQSKCAWTSHKSNSIRDVAGKMPQAKTATTVLWEPAQSKCTWTSQEDTLIPKFTGKMPRPRGMATTFARACAIEMHMDISEELLYAIF
jgi:hypothetical protein